MPQFIVICTEHYLLKLLLFGRREFGRAFEAVAFLWPLIYYLFFSSAQREFIFFSFPPFACNSLSFFFLLFLLFSVMFEITLKWCCVCTQKHYIERGRRRRRQRRRTLICTQCECENVKNRFHLVQMSKVCAAVCVRTLCCVVLCCGKWIFFVACVDAEVDAMQRHLFIIFGSTSRARRSVVLDECM